MSIEVNPTLAQLEESKLNLIMAGSKDSVMMVESGCHMLSEAQMLKALELGHEEIRRIVTLQEQLVEMVGKPKRLAVEVPKDAAVTEKAAAFFAEHGAAAYAITGKKERNQALSEAKSQLIESLSADEKLRAKEYKAAFGAESKKYVRSMILSQSKINGFPTPINMTVRVVEEQQ